MTSEAVDFDGAGDVPPGVDIGERIFGFGHVAAGEVPSEEFCEAPWSNAEVVWIVGPFPPSVRKRKLGAGAWIDPYPGLAGSTWGRPCGGTIEMESAAHRFVVVARAACLAC